MLDYSLGRQRTCFVNAPKTMVLRRLLQSSNLKFFSDILGRPPKSTTRQRARGSASAWPSCPSSGGHAPHGRGEREPALLPRRARWGEPDRLRRSLATPRRTRQVGLRSLDGISSALHANEAEKTAMPRKADKEKNLDDFKRTDRRRRRVQLHATATLLVEAEAGGIRDGTEDEADALAASGSDRPSSARSSTSAPAALLKHAARSSSRRGYREARPASLDLHISTESGSPSPGEDR